MKIAILSPWSISDIAVGGTERFVIDLAEALSNLGNQIDVYMLSGKNYKKNGINYINLKITGTDDAMEEDILKNLLGGFSKKESYIKMAEILERNIDGDKYDVIQLNSQLFLKAFKNKKRIFTIHTNPFEFIMGFGEKSFKTMIEIMKEESNNTYYVAPSEYYANEYKKLTNLEINFIPHAIRYNRIAKNTCNDEIYQKYNIEKNYRNILLPSRLEPIQKQPMLFMKAFAGIKENDRKQYQVICTGLDKQYEKYAYDIEKFCKDKKIRLKILRFDYMYEAYAIADMVVLPSKSESFGYSAIEALSLGLPTILNSIPTYMEIIKDSNNSYVFDNTEYSLKCKLEQLLCTKLERKKQPESWKNKYDLNIFRKRYIELIK